MMPGETVTSSCIRQNVALLESAPIRLFLLSLHRLLKRELGLEITSDRIEPYCCSSLAWSMREQAPQNHGTCDIQA